MMTTRRLTGSTDPAAQCTPLPWSARVEAPGPESYHSSPTLTRRIQHLEQTRLIIHNPLLAIAVLDRRIVCLRILSAWSDRACRRAYNPLRRRRTW